MNSDYLTKEEFYKHISELTELMTQYNKNFLVIAEDLKSLVDKINEHEEYLQHHNELFQDYYK